MNRVVLIGRLTKDPDLKFTPGSGNAVCTFTLAVDRNFTDKNTGKREADFVPIVVWNKTGESAANYLTKGKLAGVSGRIQTRSYEAKDGSRRYVTEVIADEIQFLEWDKKPVDGEINNQGSKTYEPVKNTDTEYGDITPVDDGDIPFRLAVSQAA